MSTNCVNKVIIIGHQLYETIGRRASEHFNIDVQPYDEAINDSTKPSEDTSVVFVTNDFSGPLFEALVEQKKSIISDIIVNQCIEQQISLPKPKYPLYNNFLKNAIICFPPTSKGRTDEVNHYLKLIRFMNGQSRRDMKSGKSFDRTHLIDNCTDGYNYRCAVIYGIPIVFKEWVDEVWVHKDEPDFDPNDQNLLSNFKIKPFYGLTFAFINFSNENPLEVEERKEMEALAVANGAAIGNPLVETCTHFVVNATKGETIDLKLNFDENERIPDFIVYKIWFTESIRIRNREEEEIFQIMSLKSRNLCRTPSVAIRSSVNSLGVLSPDYDNSFTFDSSVNLKSQSDIKKSDSKTKTKSKIQNICLEMFQTETNYVNILKNILKIFRDPLKNHEMDGQYPKEIEIKTIFEYLPPIIEVHEKILTKLEKFVQNWSEGHEIGKIFVEHSQQLLTAYPRYVNFHEDTKEMIDKCVEKYPKFDLFLKASQRNPDCGRQTLKDLLINPIQRLPRVQLYLQSLLKETAETKSDYNSLKEALNTIVEVIKRINKGKDETLGQMKMFDMLNDIEDCPATLLSSQRHFISKCDVKLLVKNDLKEINKFDNYLFTLLLFNDLILLCKKRSLKRTNSLSLKVSTNHPNSAGLKKNSKKSYKFIETIELLSIKFLLNDETNDSENAFAIVTIADNSQFPSYPFMVKVPEFEKMKFLDDISRTIRELNSNEFQENLIQNASIKSLDFTYAETIARNVSKSKYAIMRTKDKINRRFSVRRQSLNPALSLESLTIPNQSLPPSSPSSARRLSRAFSNFLSPRSLPNRNSSRYMSSMASMTSLNECSDTEVDTNFSLPTTPAPRKKKCPTSVTNVAQNMQG